MPWIPLTQLEEIEKIKALSIQRPQCIFKHSTRCSISQTAYNRLNQRLEDIEKVADIYYLDLIRYREISNHIADTFHVYHESPQILIIQHGACDYDESHMDIRPDAIIAHLVSESKI
jgi:bacillithiol system protein YtxJ